MSLIGAALYAFARGSRRVSASGWGTSLNSKRGTKKYYKGRGSTSVGTHTHSGHYQILPYKRPNYIIPDLTGFQLKPYVAWSVRPPHKPSKISPADATKPVV